jgi:hypothetical protein
LFAIESQPVDVAKGTTTERFATPPATSACSLVR